MKEFIKYILKENLPKKGIVIKEGVETSDGLKFHHTNNLPLSENVYRPFSDEYFSLINESRRLYKEGGLDLCEDDIWLLNTDIGKTGIYEGDVVWLDIPFLLENDDDDLLREAEYRGRKVKLSSPFRTPGGPKKRSVYVKNAKGNVVKVNFGDPNMKIKKSNPKRRKSFRARHKCSNPGPRWKARYWSCRAW